MGGAVSSGRDNNELVDNLMSGNYIRTRRVERVFRALDRADYMSLEAREQAYKDLAWRNGPLHLSAPCIYSEVVEALELKPGLSFLNVGSGTGYLSTLAGLIIGSSGISHGVEVLPVVIDYANEKLGKFIEKSVTLDEFDFCMPKFSIGNGLCLAPIQTYDRVYCGAGVLPKYENYFKQLTKIGGVLVMPLADTLVQLRRVSDTHWNKRNLLNVSFALLRDPDKDELDALIKLDEQTPPSLQILSRAVIRSTMRAALCGRRPELREPPPRAPPAPRACPRRICIPLDGQSDDELNELHDLDDEGGASEMNALLSLVLSMGQNRAAGSLRLDAVDDLDDENASGESEDDAPSLLGEPARDPADRARRPTDGVLMFDVSGAVDIIRRRRRPPPGAAPGGSGAGSAAEPETGAGAGAEAKDCAESGTAPAPDAPAAEPGTSNGQDAAIQKASEESTLWNDEGDSSCSLEAPAQDSKRQKLDSGIGEGASGGASPDKSDASASRAASDASAPRARAPAGDPDRNGDELESDLPWGEEDYAYSSASSDSDTESDGTGAARDALQRKILDSGIGEGAAAGRRARAWRLADKRTADGRRQRQKRGHSAGAGGGAAASSPSSESEGGSARGRAKRRAAPRADSRRRQLSLAMRRHVNELPLPHPLRKFVNLGRCFDL